MNCSRYAVV